MKRSNLFSLPFHKCDLPNQTIYPICYLISNTTMPHVEQDLLTPEITPSFWWGSRCLFFSFSTLCHGTIVCLFVLFIFSHGVVSLFSIYEFDSPFGIFRPSLSSFCLCLCRSEESSLLNFIDFNILSFDVISAHCPRKGVFSAYNMLNFYACLLQCWVM